MGTRGNDCSTRLVALAFHISAKPNKENEVTAYNPLISEGHLVMLKEDNVSRKK